MFICVIEFGRGKPHKLLPLRKTPPKNVRPKETSVNIWGLRKPRMNYLKTIFGKPGTSIMSSICKSPENISLWGMAMTIPSVEAGYQSVLS